MTKILIIDDDPQIRTVLRVALRTAGYETGEAGDGPEGLAKARSGSYGLVVLDIGLPGQDGLQVCRDLRVSSAVPVLFLTARDDEIDRILAFELGADDYVAKPFSPRELVARVRAILKRNSAGPEQTMRRGAVIIDTARHSCHVGQAAVALTAREMEILCALMRWPEQVSTRATLCDTVWGHGVPVSDRTLDSHIRNLRRKLGDAGCSDAIETVHGVGIRLGPCSA